jgi:hypothetical protein
MGHRAREGEDEAHLRLAFGGKMRKKVGDIKFEYTIVLGGETIPTKVREPLWLRWREHLFGKTYPELYFTIESLTIAHWALGKLGKRWELELGFGHAGLSGTGDLAERLRELIRLGWVAEPEKTRAKLISALLLEGNEESSCSTLHARVPA